MALTQNHVTQRPDFRPGSLVRLCWAAALYRYADSRWRGPLFLFVSILDVAVYASVLYLVVETVFELGGLNRFVPTVIGLVAFRWSVSCAIQASRTAYFASLFRSYFRYPYVAAVMVAVAGPTMIFAVSALLLTALLVLSVRDPADLAHMLGWGGFVAVVQLLWNCVLALSIIHLRIRRFLLSEIPIMLGFALLLVVSPVVYQFSDIPAAAGHMLTSLNPMAHLIAGYQNAFWYMQEISLEVLPLSACLAVILIVVLGRSARRLSGTEDEQPEETPAYLTWNGQHWSRLEDRPDPNVGRWYGRWQGELPWLSGANLFYLIDCSQNLRHEKARIFTALAHSPDSERLMTTPLPLLSHINRDRLCVATALGVEDVVPESVENVVRLNAGGAETIVLDGLLDHADRRELRAFTRILESHPALTLVLATQRRRTAEGLMSLYDDPATGQGAEN